MLDFSIDAEKLVGTVDTVPALEGPSDPLDEVELLVSPRGR
jgi:hypothetical protein